MSARNSEVRQNGQDRGVSLIRTLLQLAVVALAYWLAAMVSLRLALVHGQVTPIWPPTGIALVAILVFGRRVWPSIFLGALAVNLPIGPSPLGATLIAAGNTLAPLTAAAFLKRIGFRIELDRLRDAAAIIVLGALVAMTISATVGTSVLVLSATVPTAGFLPIWAAVQGSGPFGTETLTQKMITLQAFNVCVALTSLVLTALLEARDRGDEMTRLYAAADVASQTKSAFLNNAGHELLTPLTVLAGYLSLLADGSVGSPPEAWKAPLGILMAKTRELERIVRDLMTASRLEVLPPRLAREVIDLREVINGAVERARPRADLLGAELTADLPDDPVPVVADPESLGRALDDLLNNALTYTIRPPRLWIGMSAGSRRAIVRVEDNGVGISFEERERVFDRLYRVADPQIVVPGIGLGLYISRQLVESYGGTLAVESSTPGMGSVFALTLPLSRTVSATELREAEAG